MLVYSIIENRILMQEMEKEQLPTAFDMTDKLNFLRNMQIQKQRLRTFSLNLQKRMNGTDN